MTSRLGFDNNIFSAYCRDISKLPILSDEENSSLSAEYSKTLDLFFSKKEEYLVNHQSENQVKLDFAAEQYARGFRNLKIRDQLYCHNLKLIITLVTKSSYCKGYAQSNLLMDLIGEGNIALSKAIDYYDVRKNTLISTYISLWVKAYVLKFLLSRRSVLKLSTSPAQLKCYYKFSKVQQKLLSENGEATFEEIAKNLNVTVKQVEEISILRSPTSQFSLSSCHGENFDFSLDRQLSLEEILEDTNLESLDTSFAKEAFKQKLPGLLKDFRNKLVNGEIGKFRKTELPLKVFDARFANTLQDLDEKRSTLDEIGTTFGDKTISKQRVQQVEQELKYSLQEYLRPHMAVISSFL